MFKKKFSKVLIFQVCFFVSIQYSHNCFCNFDGNFLCNFFDAIDDCCSCYFPESFFCALKNVFCCKRGKNRKKRNRVLPKIKIDFEGKFCERGVKESDDKSNSLVSYDSVSKIGGVEIDRNCCNEDKGVIFDFVKSLNDYIDYENEVENKEKWGFKVREIMNEDKVAILREKRRRVFIKNLDSCFCQSQECEKFLKLKLENIREDRKNKGKKLITIDSENNNKDNLSLEIENIKTLNKVEKVDNFKEDFCWKDLCQCVIRIRTVEKLIEDKLGIEVK